MAASRNFLLAIALSVLAHALLLAIPVRRAELLGPDVLPSVPLLVQLVSAAPPPEPLPEPQAASPAPVLHAPEPRAVPPPRTMPRAAPELAQTPAPAARAEPIRAPPIDMMATLRALRAQRLAQEQAARAANRSREPTAEQLAEATVARNLRFGGIGVSGVFEILSKGTRSAEFAFNGWRGDSSQRWRQVIEVDAGPGGDIDRAVVRRMIELIRTHYSGDFNWESHRLGRVVVLSARPEDNAELEDFLMREFFGTPTLKQPG